MEGVKYDPKQIVTPDAFRVDPKLLGKPLATPKRRLAAALIDLVLAGILSALSPFILAALATMVILWIFIRKKYGMRFKKGFRVAFGVIGSVLIFYGIYEGLQEVPVDDNPNIITASDVLGNEAFSEFTEDAMSIDYTNNPESEEELESAIKEFTEEIKEAKFGNTDSVNIKPLPENAPKLVHAYELALVDSNKTRIDSLRPIVAPIVAGAEITELENELRFYKNLNDTLLAKNAKLKKIVENPGFMRTIKGLAGDLGLAVGWLGLYFVLMLTLGNGQTPGKKLMSLRVIRLNNQPVTLWKSFERFGGYAAGFATGLLGFLQIYWDANRQGIHDKIAETTVIDLREKRAKKYQDLVDDFIENR